MPRAAMRRAVRVRPRNGRVGLGCLLAVTGLMTSCAGGSSHATAITRPKVRHQTTPSSATSTEARAFLGAPSGKMLLDYERATDRFVAGSRPERTECEQFLRDVLPTITPSTDELLRVVSSVPDPALEAVLRQDISNRVLLLGACVSRTGLLVNQEMDRTYRLYQSHAQTATRMLRQLGFTA